MIPGRGATLGEFAKAIMIETMIQLRVGMPCEVLEWRPAIPGVKPAVVDVQPGFWFSRSIDNVDELEPGYVLYENAGSYFMKRPLPRINDVPVVYGGPPGAMFRGPIKVGTEGWLSFSDRSLDAWISEGGPVDPAIDQFHDLSDPVFFPGLRSGKLAQITPEDRVTLGPEDDAAGLDFYENNNIELRTTGANLTIEAATEIDLGEAATRGVARLDDETSADVSMAAWIASAQIILTAAANLLALSPPIAPTDFGKITTASTKVKSE